MKPAQSVHSAAERLAQKRVILLDEPTNPPAPEELWACTWFVLHTWPSWEWRVRAALEAAGFTTFLPAIRYWNATRFRVRRQLERALLTRYVFVGVPGAARRNLSDAEWSAIKQTEGVCRILGEGSGVPIPVPIEGIVELAAVLAEGTFDETRDAISAGAEVRITAGPFTGFRGIVEKAVSSEAGPEDVIEVLMTIFGRTSPAKIALADLEQIR